MRILCNRKQDIIENIIIIAVQFYPKERIVAASKNAIIQQFPRKNHVFTSSSENNCKSC